MNSEATHSQSSGRGKSQRGKKGKQRKRSIPQRTCVGCRAAKAKREMVRVVRTPDGAVTVDPGGKLPGRGAYVCENRDCWQMALKHGRLSHALKVSIDDHTTQALLAFAQTLPSSVGNTSESRQD